MENQSDLNEKLIPQIVIKNKMKQEFEQKSRFGKLFKIFKHPTTNNSVIVTKNFPSSAMSSKYWNNFLLKIVSGLFIMFFVLIC